MERYSLQDLATEIGVQSLSTMEKYRRLFLDPPEGRGRGRYYTTVHMDQARRLRELLHAPRTLEQIRAELRRPHVVRLPPRT